MPFILLTFLILTTLVFVQQVGKYSTIVLSFQTSGKVTAQFMLSLIPGIVIITLPVALLLGTVITCSRLSSDSELIAAQSLGISKLSLALPFLFFGILGTVATGYLSADIAPRALKLLRGLRAQILLEEANNRIKPHVFITQFPNVLFYVENIDQKTGEWLGVFILQQDEERGTNRVLSAERGQLRLVSEPAVSLEAELRNGLSFAFAAIDSPQTTSLPAAQDTSVFEKLSIKLTQKEMLTEEEKAEIESRAALGPLNEMRTSDVSRIARTAAKPEDRLRARVEWHRRFAFPFACLTLTVISFIVSMRGRKFSTRPRTVVIIMFIAMAFYLVMIAGQNMANAGTVPSWLGVWFSNIVLSVYAVKSFVTSRKLFVLPSLPDFPALESARKIASEVVSLPRRAGVTVSPQDQGGRTRSVRFSLFNVINYLIVSEITKYYLLALFALVVTSVIFTLFDLIPALSKSDSTIGYAAGYLGYLSPQLAYFVTPFAMLVAILTGCSVLARSNQVIALQAAGQSPLRIIGGIMIVACSLAGGLWLTSNYLLPHTNREQDIRYHRIKKRQLEQITLAFGKKWVYGKNNIIYSFQRIDGDNTLENGSMYHLSPESGRLVMASHFGRAAQAGPYSWTAADGWTDVINPDFTVQRIPLDSQALRIADGAAIFRRTVNESSKMSAEDLNDYIRQLSEIGIATEEFRLDLSKRLAFPFSCLTLALLSFPFATAKRTRRLSPLMSVAAGVGISLVFWLLMTVFEAAGKQSSLPVYLAVWGPQLLFLAIGMYLNLRYRK
ncbi:MAG: LptF/LptG family permease [Acidobacteriota bacterium]|nr:MAG: LptF/LptG family permease [Acidobacteriota bacterium]